MRSHVVGLCNPPAARPVRVLPADLHPRLVLYVPEGEPAELDIPDGHVLWREVRTHRVESIGNADLRVIIVESKRGG